MSEPPTVRLIQSVTAEFFGVSRSALLEECRTQHRVRQRQIAMYLAREMTDESFPKIGRLFAGRDHSTVIHAVKTIAEIVAHDDGVKQIIDIIRGQITNRIGEDQ